MLINKPVLVGVYRPPGYDLPIPAGNYDHALHVDQPDAPSFLEDYIKDAPKGPRLGGAPMRRKSHRNWSSNSPQHQRRKIYLPVKKLPKFSEPLDPPQASETWRHYDFSTSLRPADRRSFPCPGIFTGGRHL